MTTTRPCATSLATRWIPRKYALTCGRERVAEGAWRFKCRHITAVPSPGGDLVCLVGDTAWRCFDAATFEPLHGAVRAGRDGRTIGAGALSRGFSSRWTSWMVELP